MQRYSGYAATQAGVRSPLATIHVVLAKDGVTNATLYSTNDPANPTPLASTFQADANGFYSFYARNGRYNVVVSSALTVPINPAITYSDVLLYDPFDEFPAQLGGNIADIRAYGAVCDGVTDDTAAIRRALTALVAPTGGTLLLPANATIIVSDFIEVLSPNVEIRGGGRSTILQQTVGNKDLIRLNSNAGVTLRDFAMTQAAAWAAGSAILGAANADDLLVEDVAITNFGSSISLVGSTRPKLVRVSAMGYNGGGTGIFLSGVTNWLVQDCEILAVDTGLSVTAVSNLGFVDGLYLTGSVNHVGTALAYASSIDCCLRRVIVGGLDGFGKILTATGGSHNLLVDDFTVRTSPVLGDVFTITDSNFVRLRNHQWEGISVGNVAINGIELNNSHDALLDTVDGNGGNSFLGATNCNRLRIHSCHWSGAVSNVAVITGTSTYWKIRGCNFTGNGQGVTIQPLASYGLMTDCQIVGSTGNFGFGVELFGTKFCAIRGNTFIGNGRTGNPATTGDGIHIENSDGVTFCDFNEITGNYCYNNGKDGIFAQFAAQTLFGNNTCIGNGRNGIIIAASFDISIDGNSCYENGQDVAGSSGIGVTFSGAQGCVRPSITGNVSSREARSGVPTANQAYGIYIDVSTSNGLIDGNLAAGNATANLQNNSGSMVVGSNQTT